MHFDNIASKVNQEQALLESEVRAVVSQANTRRQALVSEILLKFDRETGHTITSEDFFASIEALVKMDVNYQEALQKAGFGKDVVTSWVTKSSCPAHYVLKPTLHLALAAMLDDLLLNKIEGGTSLLLHSGDVPVVTEDRSELLVRSIESFTSLDDLSVRVRNAFKNSNIYLLGDLLLCTESELLRIPNFGRKSLNEVIAALVETKTGFTLGCLNAEEESEALLRRRFNANIMTEIGSKFTIDGREELVDEGLLDELQKLGVKYKTELATCPKDVIEKLCDGKSGWKRQLSSILGHAPYYFSEKLELYMDAPQHLHPSVRVYQSS